MTARRPLTASLAALLASTVLATPASAAPHDRVDSLGSNSAVAMAAPAQTEQAAFGQLGFRGVTPPPPEPGPVMVAAEPEPEPDPAAWQGTVTSEARSESAAPTRSVERPEAPEPEPAPAPVSGGVLGIAASYVGSPYALGATGPSAFDCSGYTSYVYRQVGVNLPRSASAQQAYATPVSNPAPGDLVFWGYPAYHVGIYAGNGMVYDAGNPGTGVIYRSVFSGVSGYGRVL